MSEFAATSRAATGEAGQRSADAASWIARSRSDPEAFSMVFEAYFADVHSYIARRLGAEPADDLAAATFETAFAKRESFDAAAGSVRGWLLGIATRHVARRNRDEARRYRALARIADAGHADGPEETVVDRLAARADLRALAAVLAAMAPADRDVLLLVALGKMPLGEVAAALQIPYGTAGSRLNRARAQLRKHLGEAPAARRANSPCPNLAPAQKGRTDG